MRVGFVVARRTNEIEIQISAPDNKEQSALVTYSRVGDSFALLMGYLYYRSDKLAELSAVRPHDALHESQDNDAALALAVYRYLGITAVERLEGDFALVIWDAEITQLIALRDPLGGYPLFWAQHESTIAFSTNLRPLCAMLPQCLLNEDYFADFVMLQAPLSEGSSEQCVYTGIHRVLPGTMVQVRADSERVERRLYWDWRNHINDPGTSDLVEIAEQYRPLLRAAVQERMRGCTLAHLSGGMDSTSIALLAKDAICAGFGHAPLHTASLVYHRLPRLARERPYIDSVLQHETTIVSHQLVADDLLNFDAFTDPPLHDEPYPALPSVITGQLFARLATEIGALTILTGHGADEIHHLVPHYLADLLRQWQFCKAWQEATKWAKARNSSPWRTLTTFGLNPIFSVWMAGSRWANLTTKIGYGHWSVPPWIMPDFARRHALQSRAIENTRHIYQLCEQTGQSVTLSAIQSRAGDMFRWSVTAPLGITYAHPFLDPRLLTFGLGMQSRILPEPEHMKPVLAEAMRGILPETIRCRQQKGGFNEVYYLGLARNLRKLEAMIRQAHVEDMINKDLFIQYLREGSLAGVPPRGLQHLTYVLSLMKWLSMQEVWLQVHERVTDSYRIGF